MVEESIPTPDPVPDEPETVQEEPVAENEENYLI